MNRLQSVMKNHPVSSRFGLLAALFIIIGVCCFSASALIGSTIDAQGILHEPFFLIVFGYAFVGLSLLMLIGAVISGLKRV